jgi:hypothetical protein
MRLLQIRARTDDDADCLVRELAVYSPKRLRKAILIELEDESQPFSPCLPPWRHA